MFKNNNFSSGKFKPIKVLFFILVFVVVFSALSFVVMFLWNAILPEVTEVKPLNFWQAAGLLILAKILFGGFRGRKRRSGSWRNSKKNHWRNKWMEMNEEEREAAKLRWKEYCNMKKSNKSNE